MPNDPKTTRDAADNLARLLADPGGTINDAADPNSDDLMIPPPPPRPGLFQPRPLAPTDDPAYDKLLFRNSTGPIDPGNRPSVQMLRRMGG